MPQINKKLIELYVLPSFLANIYREENNNLFEINENDISDQYSKIKRISDTNIASQFKKIRQIPLSNSILDYEDDTWDFSGYTLISGSHNKLFFHNVADDFKDILKNYILLLILRGNIKISSIRNKHVKIRRFLNFINNKGINNISQLDSSDIKNFFESLEVKPGPYQGYIICVEDFLSLYDLENKTKVLSPDVQKIFERTQIAKVIKAEKKENRRYPIPDVYFDKLVQVLIRTMDDKEKSDLIRGVAAMLIIDSQTGLRASELSLLEANSVENIDVNNKMFRLLNFKIIKTAKGNNSYIKNVTYMNPLSYKAYEVLMEIFEENRKKFKTKLLFCPKKNSLPVKPNIFIYYLKLFCILNADEVGALEQHNQVKLVGKISGKSFLLNSMKINSQNTQRIDDYQLINDEAIYYYPIVHQFRNTVVDRLYRAGVNLEFIRRYMGHLSSDMTASYASYRDNDIQENINFSKDILRTYLTGEAKILGNSGNQLMARIDEWMESNNLNVEDNLEDIIDKICGIVPIRAKHGGACIKGAKLVDACSLDSKTDEFFCASGVCPNICHFFFMINVTYSDFKAAVEIYKYNKINGFTRQAEKELSKIKVLIEQRFKPELKELELEIKEKGEIHIVNRFPELKFIVDNLQEIKKEVYEWN